MVDNAAGSNRNSVESHVNNIGHDQESMEYDTKMSCFQNTPSYSNSLSASNGLCNNSGVTYTVNSYSPKEETIPNNLSTNNTNSMTSDRSLRNYANFTRFTNTPFPKNLNTTTSRTQLKQELMRQQTLQQEELRSRRHQQKYQHQINLQQQYLQQRQINAARNYPCINSIHHNGLDVSSKITEVKVETCLENPTDFHMAESWKRNTMKKSPERSSNYIFPTEGASAPTGRPTRLYSIPECKIPSKERQQPWGQSEPSITFNGAQYTGQENVGLAQITPASSCGNILLRGYTGSRSSPGQGSRTRSPPIQPISKLASATSSMTGTTPSVSVSFPSPGISSRATSVASNQSEVDDVLLQELINYERDFSSSDNSSQITTNNNNHGSSQGPDSICELLTFNENMSSGRHTDVSSPEVPQIKNEPFSNADSLTSIEPVYHESFIKDRRKKDTHNKIERSRRSHINDMIQELKVLLPQYGEQYYEKIFNKRQYKGHILTATVEYINLMRDDLDMLSNAEVQRQSFEVENKLLRQRIQKMEISLKENDISFEEESTMEPETVPQIIRSDVISSTTPTNASDSVPITLDPLQLSMVDKKFPHQEMPLVHADSTDFFNNYTDFDLMDDEPENYCTDVMLSSPPLSSPQSSLQSIEDSLPLNPMDIAS